MAGKPLTAPIVGMAVDPVTGGYWLVSADGGIAGPTTTGYWLVQSDGAVDAYGGALHYRVCRVV